MTRRSPHEGCRDPRVRRRVGVRWRTSPIPVPGLGEVVVDLRAASVNRRDRGIRAGSLVPRAIGGQSEQQPTFPLILGSDGAGVVSERRGRRRRGRGGRRGRDQPEPELGRARRVARARLGDARRAAAGDVRRADRRSGGIRAAQARRGSPGRGRGAAAGRPDRVEGGRHEGPGRAPASACSCQAWARAWRRS